MNRPYPDSNTSPGPDRIPSRHGLYDPQLERDACGVGFIAQLKGDRSHAIVADALEMLSRMDHRGACGCEENTGDGAGILTSVPHELFAAIAEAELQQTLPDPGRYAAGNIFLPQDESAREWCRAIYLEELEREGLAVLGWRVPPTDPDGADIGPTARRGMPHIEQLFVGFPDSMDTDTAERHLYLARNRAVNTVQDKPDRVTPGSFFICSLSARVMVYKGQLTSGQVPAFYGDLRDPRYVSHFAMVHSRFSTNTFPSWDRAQPNRMISHNGEINTLKGNKNWTFARQGLMQSEPFGEATRELFPIINPEASDSGAFDNVFEMLVMSGRTPQEAAMMMVPEAWENHAQMPEAKRAFYAYHANLIEPWDGPATISFTDGKVIGGLLDRNGLRPSRYYVTADDRVIMASEVGVVDVPPDQVVVKGRLQPGRMFLVDFEEGRIVPDDEIKTKAGAQRPYAQWIKSQGLDLDAMPRDKKDTVADNEMPLDELMPRLQAFGYTSEHLTMLLAPMVRGSKEALGSMGNDQALACLSDKPRLLYDYFQQLFAQVTNPPIDPIREEVIMSLQTYIGPEGNLLGTTEQQCHRLRLTQPVLRDEEIASLKRLNQNGWSSRVIDTTYALPDTAGLNGHTGAVLGESMQEALSRICDEATQAIAQGVPLVILSDREAGPGRVALPALLAVGAVHHHLVRTESRTKIGLILETGEAREVHHFCTLFGFGVDAVNPYLAFQALVHLKAQGVISDSFSTDDCLARYIKAINLGMLKVMSKMGISTLASYKGAQIFEILGLASPVVDRCFTGCPSRLEGVGFDVLALEAQRRHKLGYPDRPRSSMTHLPNPGEYHWRPEGEAHANSPQAIALLQQASRSPSGKPMYERYAKLCNDDTRQRCTLRGLLGFNAGQPIALDEVEPAAEIVKRFRTGAMSLGALSKEAHETLALAMNRIGGKSNSGEGGEDPKRFALDQYDDGSPKSRRSAIKQIASGRFGVTAYYLANADRLQIKIAQGAKPGEGGQLPGFKVDPYIASIRHSTPGVGLISPPPHHDIYSIEDLSQLIFDLKNANPSADVSVKLVAEVGVGTIASGVAKAKADHILISGHDGGTGASPLTSIKHAGLPWELGLAETHQTLVMNDLRSRVRLETDGGMRTGRDVVIAACLGAEEFGFATTPMIAVGCIMMRKCHLNTCPVGVCTQDPVLRKKFTGQPEHVINYLFLVAEEARQLMAELGVRTMDELVGRVDLLGTKDAIAHWKADGLDLTPILQPPKILYENTGLRRLKPQDHGLDTVLDQTLLTQAKPAIEDAHAVTINEKIVNTDRAAATMLSHAIAAKWGGDGLPEGTIDLQLQGSAGQSLGAWLAKGIDLTMTGDANDYVGKGLSGGTIAVKPYDVAPFNAEENVIIGNVALYGATSGKAFFRGLAAERFAVRNSGAHAVIEGVGDHGCEYMTGGRVVVLGPTGRNFAAGMSGGIAYIHDPDGAFPERCNTEMVDLEELVEPEDLAEVRALMQEHADRTGSTVAQSLLTDWPAAAKDFVKVMPVDYRKVLLAQKAQRDEESVVGSLGHG